MKRISTHELFTKMALDVAKRSTCSRIQVGAVIVKNQRVISMGWNGVPQGKTHCIEHFETQFETEHPEFVGKKNTQEYYFSFQRWINTSKMKDEHHQFAIRNEIHSEMNAMIFAARSGIATDESDIYVVWSPCIDCSKALLQAGIKNVYYNKLYERDTRGVEFLEENDVPCIQVEVKLDSFITNGNK